MWSDGTVRPLNMLLKLVSLCSRGSEDPNQHQKASMFVSTCRHPSILSSKPLNMLFFFYYLKGRDVILVLICFTDLVVIVWLLPPWQGFFVCDSAIIYCIIHHKRSPRPNTIRQNNHLECGQSFYVILWESLKTEAPVWDRLPTNDWCIVSSNILTSACWWSPAFLVNSIIPTLPKARQAFD